MGRNVGIRIGCLLLAGLLGLGGCGSPSPVSETADREAATADRKTATAGEDTEEKEYQAAELIYERTMDLQYAANFSVEYYKGGYRLLTTIMDGRRFLMVPEGMAVPKSQEEDMVILHEPAENLYLVASSAMNMFCELDSLDAITLSGQKEDGWYIGEASKAMEDGAILYAGKYNQPDYELIVSKGCSLVIENRMIFHAPEVIEKLEEFQIPVMIDASSYESHPLGRVEWIKFYGALLGKEEEAEQLFEEQVRILEKVKADEKTDKTVGFFFVTSNGLIQVRQSSDYVPKMIELAGGRYIFDDLGEPESARSTVNLQVEEFYNSARDVDFLIYNSSIDGGVSSLEELLEKCQPLADFKAVKEGNIWCTTNDMYQQSMAIGYMIEDIHTMLTGDGEKDMKYLYQLK